MSYSVTVHQPADVLHTATHDGVIRVWSVAPDGTPVLIPQPGDSVEAPSLPPLDLTATEIARASGIALPGGGAS